MTISLSLLSWLVGGEVLLELSLSLDVKASKVLLVSILNSDGAEDVKSEATTEVEGDWVLSAIVPKALKSRHYYNCD